MRKLWTIIDSYILKKFLGTFFFVILILAIISCVIDYSQKIDDFIKNQAPLSAILFFYLNFIPSITAILFPLFTFIATIYFTTRMAYRSEIIAILASGASYWRFLRPYWAGALILGVLGYVLNHYWVPMANKNTFKFQTEYVWNKKENTKSNIHLRLSPQLYIFVEGYNYVENIGQKFTAETFDGTLLKEKIMAQQVQYDSTSKLWTLKDVTIRKNLGIKEELEKRAVLVMAYPFTPQDLDVDNRIKEALTTPELNKQIAIDKQRGREDVTYYALEKAKRTAQPFAGIVLTIIGICIASKKIRGGSGLHLAIGIIISALYQLLLQFTQTFATNAGLDPTIAMWIPNFIFVFVAIFLLRQRTK